MDRGKNTERDSGLAYIECEFSCRQVAFELSLAHPEGDVEEATDYRVLLRDKGWAGDTPVYLCIQVVNEVVDMDENTQEENIE